MNESTGYGSLLVNVDRDMRSVLFSFFSFTTTSLLTPRFPNTSLINNTHKQHITRNFDTFIGFDIPFLPSAVEANIKAV
jgi:hypothetical protein